MTNTILTPSAVTREALRVLHQKLNFVGSINREYDDSYAKTGAGGTITFRVALTALGALTLWLLQAMGSQMLSAQAQFGRQQARMAQSLATLAQQTSDTARLSARNSDRLDDHEHRITVPEVQETGR